MDLTGMLASRIIFFGRLAVLILLCLPKGLSGQPAASSPCPLTCKTLGLQEQQCRDWQESGLCRLEYPKKVRIGSVFCLKPSTGRIRARPACIPHEVRLKFDDLQGPAGPQGEKGETGPAGAKGSTGEDGSARIYGDGSAGQKSVNSDETFNSPNPQYTDFTVAAGNTLTVASGTIIRCTGTFANYGTVKVQPGLRSHPHFAENGYPVVSGESSGDEAAGGEGGKALSAGAARMLLAPGLLRGGNGQKEDHESGGEGGGTLMILCRDLVLNASSGAITADGEAATVDARGGGGGGLVLLASGETVRNEGRIQANGATGGEA